MSFYNQTYKRKNLSSDYKNYYNTFNNTNYYSVRDKMENKYLNQNKENKSTRINKRCTFLKSSAPFYVCNNSGKNGLLIRYNGGPQIKLYPKINKTNLSQSLNRRSTSLKFKRPCGCLSNYNISKYSQFWDYPNYTDNYQTNNYTFHDGENMRYSNGFQTPQCKNKSKLTFKLKKNNVNDNYLGNVGESIYKKEENEKRNDANNDDNNDVNINVNNDVNNDANKQIDKIEEKEESKKSKNIVNYFRIKPKRRFHKVQIFNNYKPFLVDDFKDYADYE